MRSFSALLCLVLIALSSSGGVALSRDGAERRSNQDSDELRTDMRQRRLKKVEDLEKARSPARIRLDQDHSRSQAADQFRQLALTHAHLPAITPLVFGT